MDESRLEEVDFDRLAADNLTPGGRAAYEHRLGEALADFHREVRPPRDAWDRASMPSGPMDEDESRARDWACTQAWTAYQEAAARARAAFAAAKEQAYLDLGGQLPA